MAKFKLTLHKTFEIDTSKVDGLDETLRLTLKEEIGWDPKEEPDAAELHDAIREVLANNDLNDQTLDYVEASDYTIEVTELPTTYVAAEAENAADSDEGQKG